MGVLGVGGGFFCRDLTRDQRVGKCVFRGKECGVAGLRGGFELRKDTTTLQAQEMTKTVVKEKSYISPHKKSLCAFVRQKVCVMGRCKKLRAPCVRKS